MATQFYKTLEDILKLKEENAQRIQDRMSELSEHTIKSSYDDELTALKSNLKQLGVSDSLTEQSIEDKFIDKSRRLEFIKENNIKHGSPRWFKVMYARPELTGEDPFGE
jgi:hypothetical protein